MLFTVEIFFQKIAKNGIIKSSQKR